MNKIFKVAAADGFAVFVRALNELLAEVREIRAKVEAMLLTVDGGEEE